MICSLWRFKLLNKILLDHGEWMLEEPEMPVSGQSQQSIRPGLEWGKSFGRGNKIRSLRWSRVLEFPTPEERLGYEMFKPALAPVGESGTLIAEINGGSSFAIADFTLLSCTPSHDPNNPCLLYLSYEGEGGEMTITNNVDLGENKWGELTGTWGALTGTWRQL